MAGQPGGRHHRPVLTLIGLGGLATGLALRPLHLVHWPNRLLGLVFLGAAMVLAIALLSTLLSGRARRARRPSPAGDRVAADRGGWTERWKLAIEVVGLVLAIVGTAVNLQQARIGQAGQHAIQRQQHDDRIRTASDALGDGNATTRRDAVEDLVGLAAADPADQPLICSRLGTFARQALTLPTDDRHDDKRVPPLADRAPDALAALRGMSTLRCTATFVSVNLDERDLRRADLHGTDFTRGVLSWTDAWMANLSSARLERADLTGSNFDYATLTGADLAGAKLQGASLDGTQLQHANLAGVDLSIQLETGRRAHLHGADLSGADLRGADLRGADLSPVPDFHEEAATLRGADLRGAHLEGTRLAGADLTGANLAGVTYDAATTWPAGFGPGTTHAATATPSPMRPSMT